MDRRTQQISLALLIVCIAAVVLLAPSLTRIQLGPGDPFPGAGGPGLPQPVTLAERSIAGGSSSSVLSAILAAILVLLFGYLLLKLATFTNLRVLAGILGAVAVVTVLLLSLPRVAPGSGSVLPPESMGPGSNLPKASTTPLEAPPPLLLWVVGAAILVGVCVVFVAAIRSRASSSTFSTRLARQASEAVRELRSGAESTDVIVRCYFGMVRLIREQRGLERQRDLTVREFEADLDALRLPRDPLIRLRTLFEAVRYGDREMSAADKANAFHCLDDLAEALKVQA